MSDNIQHNPQTTIADGLATSMQGLASQAEALLHSTSTLSNQGVAALRKGVSDGLSEARDAAMARGRQVAGATQAYVSEKPWQAIAIAALLGIAIGYFSRGVRR